jgi:hypothetical protein
VVPPSAVELLQHFSVPSFSFSFLKSNLLSVRAYPIGRIWNQGLEDLSWESLPVMMALLLLLLLKF